MAGCFAYLFGKPDKQIVVCFGCTHEDYVRELKGKGQQLVSREINSITSVSKVLAMELDLFRRNGSSYEVDLGSRKFDHEEVEEASRLLEKFTEEKFEEAMFVAIRKKKITRDHIWEWRFSDSGIRDKFAEIFKPIKEGDQSDKLLRRLAEFVINNKTFIYCQPTLDMFKGVEEAAVLFEAYAALHDKSGLPLWSSLTEQKRSEYLAAVLLLWGGPNDATPRPA